MNAVFEAVRKTCSPQMWSRGIELVRADAVIGERAEPGEAVLRISLKGGMIARTVTLWTDDGDWECTCGARSGCEHAAAAVIALKRARDEGKDLPGPKFAVGQIAYRLRRGPNGLVFERGIEVDGSFHSFEATLAALAEKRVEAPPFTASQADLAVELALGQHRRGAIPGAIATKLLAALAGTERLTLDGVPVRASASPVLPRGIVTEQGDGFRLALEDDRTVDEAFGNGIVRCGELLRPVGDPRLTGRELHELPHGVRYAGSDVALLVTEILPELAKRIPIDVQTNRLPRVGAAKPRIALETRRDGESLSVLGLLVYGDPPVARVDGGRLVHLSGEVPLRDTRSEERLVRQLADELGLSPGVPKSVRGEDAVALASRLAAWGGVAGSGREHFALAAPLVARLTIEGDDFEVAFEAPAASGRKMRSADPGAVVRAWQEGASMVSLLGGGYAPIPTDWLARFGARIADLLAARAAAGTLPASVLPDLGRLAEALDQPPPPGLSRLRALAGDFAELPSAELPADLEAELRPYQRRGVDWLVFLRETRLGALLADDMGLGKTLQALCALQGRTLVVAPTSVLPNWMSEIRRFRPGLRAALYHGPRRQLDPEADVTVTSYALLRLDEAELRSVAWDTAILDEAQSIKNPESQAAQAAFGLRAGFRVALSGTPVENRLDELWSEMHFLNPGLLGGRKDFQDRYARPIGAGDPDTGARLRARLRPFVLRRLKDDVAPELPPRTDATLYCELNERERRVYDAVRAATLTDVVAKLQEGGSVLAALEALLRLRQAACHSALVPGQAADTSSKVELLVETLDTVVAEEHKALVFSQWTSLLDRIEPHLTAAAIPYLRLDGSTVDRGGVVAGFQDPAGPPVLLVSLKAGGTGLNLTRADHVFLMDPWWNPAVEDQAADRAHRIGQDRPVMVYRLVAEDTVEEKILELQEAKRALAQVVLGEGGKATELTRADLLALLQ